MSRPRKAPPFKETIGLCSRCQLTRQLFRTTGRCGPCQAITGVFFQWPTAKAKVKR